MLANNQAIFWLGYEANLPSSAVAGLRFKKILLLLLDSLYSGSNKNLPELTNDEKWLKSEYFPMLCQHPESHPEDC
ncbi:hypothetical protein [Nostoc sp. UHCC 0870]|uniref:hypothetical protein n=1 Tax=Nostoc sp. UHCC 0870 TaxID=2914041 RepID=UPI001EDF1A6B|nr:hypothetical protein [Nostoc sp. UHCC 0870]UKP01538.1 hypothetical protein L6494_30340 [Nostoc sp. UHCC 0870]